MKLKVLFLLSVFVYLLETPTVADPIEIQYAGNKEIRPILNSSLSLTLGVRPFVDERAEKKLLTYEQSSKILEIVTKTNSGDYATSLEELIAKGMVEDLNKGGVKAHLLSTSSDQHFPSLIIEGTIRKFKGDFTHVWPQTYPSVKAEVRMEARLVQSSTGAVIWNRELLGQIDRTAVELPDGWRRTEEGGTIFVGTFGSHYSRVMIFEEIARVLASVNLGGISRIGVHWLPRKSARNTTEGRSFSKQTSVQ